MSTQPRYTRDFDNPNADPRINEGVTAMFFTRDTPKFDPSGHEIPDSYETVELVRIFIAGDSKAVGEFRVTPEHKLRFARAYEAFKKGEEQSATGTPIEMLPDLDAITLARLKVMNVFTVEGLAELPDGYLDNLGLGARQLRVRAKSFLAKVKKPNPEIDELKAQIAALQAQIGAEPKKRGRKADATAEPEGVNYA